MTDSIPARTPALIVLSSARVLPLSEPAGHPGHPTGFFMPELGAVLAAFENDYDFILATPDGRPPQLDINGLALNFQAGASLGPATVRTTLQTSALRLDPDHLRAANAGLRERRDAELVLARRHLGRITVSEPLPHTDKEAASIRDEVVRGFAALPEHRYFSISQLIGRHRSATDDFSFDKLAFVHMPGGHAPMVDFHDNPWMGELLNSLRDNGVPISLICHAPIALSSARYRIDDQETVVSTEDHPFKGAHITAVGRHGERLILDFQFIKVPGQRTRVPYYVDDLLKEAGYHVDGRVNPAGGQVVWDEKHLLLTANGPQAVDEQTEQLSRILQLSPSTS